MDVSEIIRLFENTLVEFADMHIISIPPKTIGTDNTTHPGTCGIVIPISGSASFLVEEREYILRPGRVLFAGNGMRLRKMVLSQQEWRFVLLHYRCSYDKRLEKQHFCLDVGAEKNYEMIEVVKRMEATCDIETELLPLYRRGLLYELIMRIFQLAMENQQNQSRYSIEPALRIIRHSLATPPDIQELARNCRMNEKQFYYQFKQQVGISPKRYMILYRIDEAKKLLSEGLTVSEVSAYVGYSDPLFFSRLFKKYCGVSPTEYKCRIEQTVSKRHPFNELFDEKGEE